MFDIPGISDSRRRTCSGWSMWSRRISPLTQSGGDLSPLCSRDLLLKNYSNCLFTCNRVSLISAARLTVPLIIAQPAYLFKYWPVPFCMVRIALLFLKKKLKSPPIGSTFGLQNRGKINRALLYRALLYLR